MRSIRVPPAICRDSTTRVPPVSPGYAPGESGYTALPFFLVTQCTSKSIIRNGDLRSSEFAMVMKATLWRKNHIIDT